MQVAFERKLSQWTEYNTELNLSKFGLFSGHIKIQDIRLKNKLNFFNQNLFEASQIIIQIDSNTYFNELVVIKSVELKSPKFFFEIKNIKNKELKDNLNLIDKLSKKQKPKIYPPKKKDKNFVINNLKITNAKAFIKYEKYDKNVAIPLSDMSFSKVGNSGHFDPKFQHYKNVMKNHNKQGFLKVINNRNELELHDVEKMIRDCGLSKTQSMPMFKANLALYELGYRQKFNKNKAFWLKIK